MPDLSQVASELKGLPDQALQYELANPSGAVPSYLVLAEAQRRATLRSGAAQNGAQQPSSVYDDVMRGMMSGQPAPGPPAPPGATPPSAGPPPGGPPGPPPTGLASVANGGGSPPPPSSFQTPKNMAEGGSVDSADDEDPQDPGTGDDYTPPAQGSADRSAPDNYDRFIQDSADRHKLSPNLIRAVMARESNNDSKAVSKKGAAGLMQLMPDTAQRLGVKDITDPAQNIEGGAKELRRLLDKYNGNMDLALAGYNAGDGAVDKYGGIPPFKETRAYVPAVKKRLADLEAANAPPAATAAPPLDNAQESPNQSLVNAVNSTSAPTTTQAQTEPASVIQADVPQDVAANLGPPAAPGTPPAPAPAPATTAAATPPAATGEADRSADPHSDENISRQQKMFERLYGSKAEPSAALKAEIARLQAQAQYTAKPNFWQSLADFGWGMAASPAHSLITQIGAGGQAMTQAQAKRMDEARKTQLDLLGVNVKLDDETRAAQGKIAGLTGQAVNQAAAKQTADFENLRTSPGAMRGGSNENPGAGYRFVPNPSGGQGIWLPPTTSTITDEMLPFVKGMKRPDGKDFQVGDTISATQAGKIQDKLLQIHAKELEGANKPPAALTGDNRLIAVSLGYDPDNLTQAQAAAVYAKKKPEIELTPDQVDFHARAYLQGVPLPNLGMGPSGARLRQQVLARSADLAHGETLAASRAEGQSDTGSLKRLTPQLDAVQAFENTANANLDLMLNTAKPLIDSGSPWINKPLREVETSGFGDKELAAYQAARQVAVTEIAKVTNNPSLSGQLSDSARKEVMGLIPEEATLGQIYSVAKILKQDMANRRNSLIGQRDEIIKRLGGGAATTSPGAAIANAPRIRTATDPKTKRKVQTTDGGKTWTWSDTGERFQ